MLVLLNFLCELIFPPLFIARSFAPSRLNFVGDYVLYVGRALQGTLSNIKTSMILKFFMEIEILFSNLGIEVKI